MTINVVHLSTLAVSIGLGICLILHFKSQMNGWDMSSQPQARSTLERLASVSFIALWLVLWSAALLITVTIAFVVAKLNASIVSVLVLLFLGTWLTAAIAGWFAAVAQLISALLGHPIPRLKVWLRMR